MKTVYCVSMTMAKYNISINKYMGLGNDAPPRRDMAQQLYGYIVLSHGLYKTLLLVGFLV